MRRAKVHSAFLIVTLCAEIAVADGFGFTDSPHRKPIPDEPACDVSIAPANAAVTLRQLDDPGKRVFCVEPGDYRSEGRVVLNASGTDAAPRVLRFASDDGVPNAVQRTRQAIFEALFVRGSHWVIHGLTFRPRGTAYPRFVTIGGGDFNVIDGNLIDGVDQLGTGNVGVMVNGSYGDPATHNTIQANVIRRGNQSRLPVDYFGVLIAPGQSATETNDFNEVLDNEIYDWGDGVAVGGSTTDCTEPAIQHGTVIDGNDIYLTGDKRIDCASGAADPDGDCACAENGIDVKAYPSSTASDWTQITNNRIWGYRPTAACGGSGAIGQAITGGSLCPRHVFVARNVVSDSTIGIEAVGADWIVAGNLIHDVHVSNGKISGSIGLMTVHDSSGFSLQFNTIVDADSAYEDAAANSDARCNVVMASPGLRGAGTVRGANHVTAYNALYQSSEPNILGSTNSSATTVSASGNSDYCYWRRRWTAHEFVCVPGALTTRASPHLANQSHCDTSIGAAFGFPTIALDRSPGCGLGAETAGLLALVHRLRRRSRWAPTSTAAGKERAES